MKTFKELQEGDKIYYYDKGKIHEQTVHSVIITHKTRSYYGYKEDIEELTIIAGKNNRTKLEFYFYANSSYAKLKYMPRFACIEAARNFIERKKENLRYKINYIERRLNSLNKTYNMYNSINI